MTEIFEIAMICLFGASWPMNVIKSYKTRTAKGKSIFEADFVPQKSDVVNGYDSTDFCCDERLIELVKACVHKVCS